MIRIRMLTSVTGGIELPAGWEGEVPDDIAKDLLKAGHAEPIGGKSPAARAENATSRQATKAEKR